MALTHKADSAGVPGWCARLELGFEARRDKSVLAHRRRFGPLAVQRPFYPEDKVCHAYILHPPGGVVGGDQLSIEVSVSEQANALITTPGAAKFYRSEGAVARQSIDLKVAGALEWLPQENILFRGARVRQQTRVELRGDARFIGGEIHCLGRPANAERFDHGRVDISLILLRDGAPLQVETTRLSPSLGRDGPACLRGYPVTGVVYATPVSRASLGGLQEALSSRTVGDYFALTLIGDLLVARYLGDSTRRAQQRFTALWQKIRPEVMSRPACIPRIWNT